MNPSVPFAQLIQNIVDFIEYWSPGELTAFRLDIHSSRVENVLLPDIKMLKIFLLYFSGVLDKWTR